MQFAHVVNTYNRSVICITGTVQTPCSPIFLILSHAPIPQHAPMTRSPHPHPPSPPPTSPGHRHMWLTTLAGFQCVLAALAMCCCLFVSTFCVPILCPHSGSPVQRPDVVVAEVIGNFAFDEELHGLQLDKAADGSLHLSPQPFVQVLSDILLLHFILISLSYHRCSIVCCFTS